MKKNLFFIKKGIGYLSRFKNGKVILMLVIFFSCLLGSSNFLFSLMLQKLVASALLSNRQQFILFSLIFLVSSATYGVIYYTVQKYKEVIAQKICKAVKSDLLAHVLSLPILTKQKYGQGKLLTRLSEDTENVARYVTNVLVPVIQITMSVVTGTLYILYYSWLILVIAFIMVLVFVVLNTRLSKSMQHAYDALQGVKEIQKDFFQDMFRGADVIKIFDVLAFLRQKFDKIYQRRFFLTIQYAKNRGTSSALTEGAILVIELLILIVGIFLVQSQALTIAVLIGIWNASIGTLIYPFMDFPMILARYSEVSASWQRISEIYQEEREAIIADVESVSVDSNQPILEIRDLEFHYSPTEKVLNQINLTVKKVRLLLSKERVAQENQRLST